jgi:hypothetical protein
MAPPFITRPAPSPAVVAAAHLDPQVLGLALPVPPHVTLEGSVPCLTLFR